MDKKKIAKYLDLANHHADARPEDIRLLCTQVRKYGFNSAFVNGCYVVQAVDLLQDKGKVGTVISFPLGQDSQDAKVMAVIKAVKDGADELDVSMNVGWFQAGRDDLVLKEMKAVVQAAKGLKKSVIVKFIIETGYLSVNQIKKASELVLTSKVDFVKICSGMGPRGAKVDDVKLIRQVVGNKIKIKVAGGVHDYDQAVAFIKAGADRIGTSRAVEMVK